MTWTDIEDIAEALLESLPGVDPTAVRFDKLRQLIEALPDFEPEPDQQVNEQILEAIQAEWIELREEEPGAAGDENDDPRYRPNDPFR
ncbi:MAG: Fe-S cluster assembly protein IscX [Planctomycetota bacterium]